MAVAANTPRLTPFALWRSRLPASIGNWFARDLTRAALDLADGGPRYTLRSVEGVKIEARRARPRQATPCAVGVGKRHRAAGAAQRLYLRRDRRLRTRRCDARDRAASRRGAGADRSGRRRDRPDLAARAATSRPRARARSVWPVISAVDGKTLSGGARVRYAARLRGVIRDAESILAMMESTPPDDWDNADRELIRDEARARSVRQRVSQRASRARSSGSPGIPGTRFDDEPSANRHPVELRAVRHRRARSLTPACRTIWRPVRTVAVRTRRAANASDRVTRCSSRGRRFGSWSSARRIWSTTASIRARSSQAAAAAHVRARTGRGDVNGISASLDRARSCASHRFSRPSDRRELGQDRRTREALRPSLRGSGWNVTAR